MLIRTKAIASDGTILSDDFADLDRFIQTGKKSGSFDRPLIVALRKALRPSGGSYRLDVMGGMYVEVSKTTLADAKAVCRELGYSLSCKPEYREYRVAPYAGTPQQREDRACYSDDIADAIGTARNEASRDKELNGHHPHLTGNDNHDEANCPGGADCPYRCPPRRE